MLSKLIKHILPNYYYLSNKTNIKKIFLVFLCLFTSLILTLPVLCKKNIDRDFFAFYYVGRGVTNGGAIYNDFSDNKGVILYIFFAALYSVFGINYVVALFTVKVIIEGLTIYLLLTYTKKFRGVKFFQLAIAAVLAVFITKRFSTTLNLSGFYSENLAVFFIALSLVAMENGKKAISAATFMLAVFTRQTSAFFIIPIIYLLYKKSNYKNILIYLFYIGISLSIILAFIYANNGTLYTFYENAIKYNVTNVKVLNSQGYSKLETIISSDIIYQILLLLFFTHIGINKKSFKEEFSEYLYIYLLIIAGAFSIFLGGRIFQHHFTQFAPAITYLIIKFLNKKFSFTQAMLVSFLILFNLTVFALAVPLPYKKRVDMINKAINSYSGEYKYLQLTANYQQVYIDQDISSPDKYYQIYYLSNHFSNPIKEIDIHRENLMEKRYSTLFVGIEFTGIDNLLTKEYLYNFSDVIKPEVIKSYDFDENHRVILYRSADEKE